MITRSIDRNELKQNIKRILEQHIGRNNAIESADLLRRTTGEIIIPASKNEQTRIIRSLIDQLQAEGVPVVHIAGTSGGYFMAESDEDLDMACGWFMKRLKTAARRIMALKKITIDQLIKQIELEFEDENQQ